MSKEDSTSEQICTECKHDRSWLNPTYGRCMFGFIPPDISPGCGCKCSFSEAAEDKNSNKAAKNSSGPRVGRGYRPFLDYVELCPLHASAPSLYHALVDLVRQLPNDERLADFNLDHAETALALARDNQPERDAETQKVR